MSIYITQQKKEELEKELKFVKEGIHRSYMSSMGTTGDRLYYKGKQDALNKILSEAIVLPVEESWSKFYNNSDSLYNQEDYPNGVIIKSKE
jgi:hypothetical protein